MCQPGGAAGPFAASQHALHRSLPLGSSWPLPSLCWCAWCGCRSPRQQMATSRTWCPLSGACSSWPARHWTRWRGLCRCGNIYDVNEDGDGARAPKHALQDAMHLRLGCISRATSAAAELGACTLSVRCLLSSDSSSSSVCHDLRRRTAA